MSRKVLAGVAAALVAVGGVTGCETGADASRVVKDTDDEAVVELGDGHRVSLRYRPGTGLVERHRSAADAPWSASRTLYATETEPCQGIDLEVRLGTVAVRANFADYCRDGEPPAETVAAVGTGEFGAWDTHVSKDWDGWDRVRVAGDGRSATFSTKTWNSGTTLDWHAGQGFGEQRTVYKQLGERFLGTWRAKDGSHRLTFRQAAPNRPASLTVETLKGTDCQVRMDVVNIWEDTIEPSHAELLRGRKTTHCPAPQFESKYVLRAPGGEMVLRKLDEAKALATYTKADRR
ncbi:hypothetical protein RCO28_15150 [Streptomyces sp. LHD-70]|uniref:hypothetical protein n=1 Tax=Streptomyces sp. LHD-70 TaxID=3072140 RepID=UPI00280C495A|nr:hypothetical protein [Streptomyces sp. LHD-70]MDQ8703818.1 hypothetical protein [Streptomyces sp. LHD-70]